MPDEETGVQRQKGRPPGRRFHPWGPAGAHRFPSKSEQGSQGTPSRAVLGTVLQAGFLQRAPAAEQ